MKPAQHVAFVVPELGSGGAERAVANLASALAARGRTVTVFTLRSGGAYEQTMDPQVTIVNLSLSNARKVMAPLAREIKARKVDVIVSVLFHLDFYTLLSRLLHGWKARIVLCFQNTPSVVAQHSASGSERLLMRLYKTVAGKADGYIAISHGVGEDAAAYFGLDRDKVTIISNPIVDPDAPRPTPVALAELFEQPVEKILIASGRLTKQKDYPTLLAALTKVNQSRRVGLVVLGDGELRDELTAQVSDLGLASLVRFVGFQKRPLDWMAGGDLFVLSSLWEGLANVVVEALDVGLPVVSTDCPYGPREILKDGELGAVVPVADPDALALAILSRLEGAHNPQPGRERALDFSIGKIAERYEDVLRLRGFE